MLLNPHIVHAQNDQTMEPGQSPSRAQITSVCRTDSEDMAQLASKRATRRVTFNHGPLLVHEVVKR
ncbi:hypothetical protein M404DRAFT_1005212 [Pisolithus tinctorius Marx 270]|uniref:Uncharacterized protein n=1 Tax=Pisolithus tinctorius Marx 270 TaxID=870435 RepID=A0A0C3NSR7_PISTI|nr:hypothetical protein M404DRAFT_1005212 [Pisolithus tinctorius Marx 270]